MRFYLVLIPTILLLASLTNAQEGGVNFHTPAAWQGESIPLPPGFARDLKWHGVEHIRFAPGMFDPQSESFFSYILVFLLSKEDDVSEKAMSEQILTYYRGLAKAVMGRKGMAVDTNEFQLKQEAAEGGAAFIPAAAGDQDVKSWNAVLRWTEPFATQKPQTLNFEVHLWKQGDAPVVFFTVSPQPMDHEIWKEMRGYRAAFETTGE